MNGTADFESIVHLASLNKEEYRNPFIVFQKAFAEITQEQYEFYLCDMVHLSLSPCAEEPNYDVMTPYIHLIKMLDASLLMREIDVEKIKNNEQP